MIETLGEENEEEGVDGRGGLIPDVRFADDQRNDF